MFGSFVHASSTSRTCFRRFALLFLGLALLPTVQCSKGEQQADQPILILISLDTVRASALSCYGNERLTTPNLDQLSKEGARFTTAYSNIGYTPSSHASMFSGLYPNRHSVDTANKFFEDVPLLAEILQTNGFLTAAAVVSPPMQAEYGLGRGFDEYHTNVTPNARLEVIQRTIQEGVAQKRGSFVFLHYMDAHYNNTPTLYRAPPPFRDQFSKSLDGALVWKSTQKNYARAIQRRSMIGDSWSPRENEYLRARYEECVAYLDFEVGRVIEALKDMGIYERATLVVTSDHGECIGRHQRYGHSSVWEDVTRVPLIIKPPQKKQTSPLEVEGIAELVDLFPTLLDAGQVIYPMEGLDGKSLWPCAQGQVAVAPKNMAFGNIYLHQAFLRRGRYKLVRTAIPMDGQPGLDRLFDLETDPHENTDLLSKQPVVALELQTLLDLQLVRSNRPLMLMITGDATMHSYKVTLTTEGRFRIENLIQNSYAFDFAVIEDKRLVIEDEMDFIGRWFLFDSMPVSARVTVHVEVDGVPMPSRNIYCGNKLATQDGEFTFKCDDPTLAGPLPRGFRQNLTKEPGLIILRTTTAPSKRYAIQPDAREKMKNLGYL